LAIWRIRFWKNLHGYLTKHSHLMIFIKYFGYSTILAAKIYNNINEPEKMGALITSSISSTMQVTYN